MAIRMTRAEYEAKYGEPVPEQKKEPIRMTRAEYNQKYNNKVDTFAFDVPEKTKPVIPRAQKIEQLRTEAAEAEKAAGLGAGFKNFGKAFVENIAPSEVGLGRTISAIATAGDNTASDQMLDTQRRTLQAIRDKEARGEDATRLKQLYNELGVTRTGLPKNQSVDDIGTGQVVGQLTGTALDTLTAGTFGKAAQGLKTGALGVARPTILPSGNAGLFSKEAAKNVGIGGGIGYGFDVSLGLQEGEENPYAPGLGTLIGTALPILGRFGQSGANVTKAQLAARSQKAAKKVDELAGAIVQGKSKDIEVAKRALDEIDIEGVQTYQDLSEAITDRIGVVSRKLDDVLETDTTRYSVDDLSTKTKVGEREVKQNFVEDAFDHLEELYVKTGEPVEAERIAQLRQSFIENGATVKELNELARTYGQEFGSKAFSKVTGEPLTSYSAQSYENVRSGLKETARSRFDNPLYERADSHVSDLYRVRDLTDKMVENVNRLQQRITDRGLGERFGRAIAKLVDLATFRAGSGFVQNFFPRGQGLKTQNALELQSALEKRLKKLQEITNSQKSQEEIVTELEKFLQSLESVDNAAQ